MKKFFLIGIMMMLALGMQAQRISYIETTRSWYYIYDENGKKLKGISRNMGELKCYGSSFYLLQQGTSFYVSYDPTGRRIHAWGRSTVGEIVGASGDTFTSQRGSWIYTWHKNGKKISARSKQ